MIRASALALLLVACNGPVVVPTAEPANPTVVATAKVPQRADLPCFPCHSQVKFEQGERFPHKLVAHKGHCHTCHVWTGHHGREIDRTVCLTCHDERLARSDKPGK